MSALLDSFWDWFPLAGRDKSPEDALSRLREALRDLAEEIDYDNKVCRATDKLADAFEALEDLEEAHG